MSYKATVFNVMIASPSDVPDEREVVREVVESWNAAHSRHNGIVLRAIGWETDVAPEMGAPPQQIVNNRLLVEADILIAIFWSRMGTPTKSHESGTVEEIEAQINATKPTMVYFSTKPLPQNHDREQFDKLQAFRTTCQTRGIFQQFDNAVEFRRLLTGHLAKKVNEVIAKTDDSVDFVEIFERGLVSDQEFSEKAKTLLDALAKSNYGEVIVVNGSEGISIIVEGKDFAEACSAREEAEWKSALRELSSKGLLHDESGKGEVYSLTGEGFSFAEKI